MVLLPCVRWAGPGGPTLQPSASPSSVSRIGRNPFSRSFSVSARTGRFRTLHHRGPLHPGHIFLNSVRQVVPEEVRSVRVDSPSGMMLVGRGLVPLRGAR